MADTDLAEILEAPSVRLVPTAYFFCRTLALPEEIGEGEFGDYAALQLEELSPFPLDLLNWGYVADLEHRSMLIHAAARNRLGKNELEAWEGTEHVFPDFFALLPAEPNCVRGLWQHGSLVVLRFGASPLVPERIQTRALGQGEDEPAAASIWEAFLSLTQGETAKLYRFHAAEVDAEGRLRIGLVELGDPGQQPWPSAEVTAETPADENGEAEEKAADAPEVVWTEQPRERSWRWTADIRDEEVIRETRRGWQIRERAWQALRTAGLAAALLIVLGFTLAGFQYWQEQRMLRVAERQDQVLEVTRKMEFLNRLNQFSGKPFRPLHILAEFNEIRIRLGYEDTVDIQEVDMINTGQVQIRGSAGDVGQVNRMAREMEETGHFAQIETDWDPRGNRVQYLFEMIYLGPTSDAGSGEGGST